MEVIPFILSRDTREGEWLALHHGHITLKEIALGTHWIETWVGPEAGLEFVAKRKINLSGNNVNHCINVCGKLYRILCFLFCLMKKRKEFCLELRQQYAMMCIRFNFRRYFETLIVKHYIVLNRKSVMMVILVP